MSKHIRKSKRHSALKAFRVLFSSTQMAKSLWTALALLPKNSERQSRIWVLNMPQHYLLGNDQNPSSRAFQHNCRNIPISLIGEVLSVIAFYEKVIKVKADVAAFLS